MRRRSLALKFFVPVGAVLLVLFVILTLLVGHAQTHRAQRSFEENLQAIATNSRYMLHWEAEAYCKKEGMAYHRVPLTALSSGPVGEVERAAIQAFRDQPLLESFKGSYAGSDGAEWTYILSPGRLQDGCIACHQALGMLAFDGRKVGDFVAVFGISRSTAEILQQERTFRWESLGVGVVTLTLMAFLIVYFVRRVILQPLGSLGVLLA